MIDITTNEAIGSQLIALGLLLNLAALYFYGRARFSRVPRKEQKIIAPTPREEKARIETEFRAFTAALQPAEGENIYEIPVEHIRPGDLLKTVKMPPFVQSFKRQNTRSDYFVKS